MHDTGKEVKLMIQKETTGMMLRKLRGDNTQEEIAAALGITKDLLGPCMSVMNGFPVMK